MVLAAGRGRRLAPLTDELPKPAVPVANRPMACYALERLHRLGVREVAVNAHHLAPRLVEALETTTPEGMTLRFSIEETLLGTAGGVARMSGWLREGGHCAVVMNGDLLFEAAELDRAVSLHRERGAYATMLVRPDPRAVRFGIVEVDAWGRVLRVAGHPGREGPASPAWSGLFTGAWVLSDEAIGALPARGCLVRDGVWRWLEAGHAVLAVRDESAWRDLGTLRRYAEAQWALAEGTARWEGVCREGAEGIVHPSARVGEGARVRACVFGAGVRVAPGSELERVIAWPGARLEGTLREVVVTGRQQVPVPEEDRTDR